MSRNEACWPSCQQEVTTVAVELCYCACFLEIQHFGSWPNLTKIEEGDGVLCGTTSVYQFRMVMIKSWNMILPQLVEWFWMQPVKNVLEVGTCEPWRGEARMESRWASPASRNLGVFNCQPFSEFIPFNPLISTNFTLPKTSIFWVCRPKKTR